MLSSSTRTSQRILFSYEKIYNELEMKKGKTCAEDGLIAEMLQTDCAELLQAIADVLPLMHYKIELSA